MTDATDKLPDDQREIGETAVWSVSSAKPGFGVEKLRDDDIATFWQSDGAQPHLVNVQFNRRVTITELAFYVDIDIDESYTPSKVAIKAGTNFHDLEEIKVTEINGDAKGWVRIPLSVLDGTGLNEIPLRANLVQLGVLANNENGRDCHVRLTKPVLRARVLTHSLTRADSTD